MMIIMIILIIIIIIIIMIITIKIIITTTIIIILMITIIIITINRQKDIKTYLVTSLVSCFFKIIKKSNFPLLNIKKSKILINKTKSPSNVNFICRRKGFVFND